MNTASIVRKTPQEAALFSDFVGVTALPEYLRKANRRVNGANADRIPDMVVSAIASCYGNGGYPVHWDEKRKVYVMDTTVYHIEINATERTAIMWFWPLGPLSDYSHEKPSTTHRFVLLKGGRR